MEQAVSYERIKGHKSLVERIVDDLQAKIIKGLLEPGQRMVEAELCERMGVSRSPLREAFRILESQGFLTRQPRKGMHVSSVTLKEAEDIYAIRANLESLATRLAVERRDPETLKTLKRLHEEMMTAGAEGDRRAYHRLNLRFHEVLIEASGNRRLAELVSTFSKQTNRYRLEVLSLPGKIESSIHNHEELIASYERGDAEEAERIRKEAIVANVATLRHHFTEEGVQKP